MESLETTNTTENINQITLTLGDIFKLIKDNLWKLLFSSLLLGGIAAIYAIRTPDEYVSEAKLLPEIEAKDAGGSSKLKSLAGLAGVDLGSASTEAIRPDLYPSVVQSLPFLLKVQNEYVNSYNLKRQILLKDFLNLPVKGLFGGVTVPKPEANSTWPTTSIKLSYKEMGTCQMIQSRIAVTFDKKTGIITVSVKMQDPYIAAQLADYTQNYLTKYVGAYRTGKAKKDVLFFEKRVAEAKVRYDRAQYALSSFNDSNKALFMNIAKDQTKKLQYELDLAFNLYSDLTKQLEEAKIKIHKETPIFAVLESASVPLIKSEPKRSLMIAGGLFLGFFITFVFLILRKIKLF
ncbi:MAG: hypothetical protein KA313_08300 [Pseudarcicella sp.]|nr:hypothetical protein [Pseudarcicella sp.]MBP6411083.1 hypothetical protein [Pseudarcicella sp.]